MVLAATALLLGGVVLFTQARQSSPNLPVTAQGQADASPIFDFQEADVVQLEIETPGQAVAFERDDDGFWQMTVPTARPAEEAAIAFLLSRITTDGLVKTTPIEASNQADFGLDVPFATVELTLTDGATHTLVLGDADFSGQNYYALVDPPSIPLSKEAGEVEVAIVAENILNGVDRPLEEWQAVVDEAVTPSPAENGDGDEPGEDSPSELPNAPETDTVPEVTTPMDESEPANSDEETDLESTSESDQ